MDRNLPKDIDWYLSERFRREVPPNFHAARAQSASRRLNRTRLESGLNQAVTYVPARRMIPAERPHTRMMNRRLVAVLLICSLWACIASAEKPAKLRRNPDPVFGQYIVVLDEESREHVSEVSQAIAQEHGARVRSSWNRALVGFSANMNEAQAEAMTRNPHVVFIEEDSYMYLSTEQLTDATRWNLDRLDQVGTPLFSGTFSYGNPGVTVRAYVMDTGVMATHDEFRLGLDEVGTGSSRVEAGVSFVADGYAANAPCTAEPDETLLIGGHGTAVASVLGGRRMGVAKNVRIIPVRTVNCSGTGVVSASIDGLNWILDHYDTHAYAGVVNISN